MTTKTLIDANEQDGLYALEEDGRVWLLTGPEMDQESEDWSITLDETTDGLWALQSFDKSAGLRNRRDEAIWNSSIASWMYHKGRHAVDNMIVGDRLELDFLSITKLY